jgi:hypothetical protein
MYEQIPSATRSLFTLRHNRLDLPHAVVHANKQGRNMPSHLAIERFIVTKRSSHEKDRSMRASGPGA